MQVASKTNDSAGDGTTTACVLARELIRFGLLNVTAGANPVAIKKGIDKTIAALVEELKRQARPVKGCDDIKGRAMVMTVCSRSMTYPCSLVIYSKLCAIQVFNFLTVLIL